MATYCSVDDYLASEAEKVLEQHFGVKLQCRIWVSMEDYTKTLGVLVPLPDGTEYLFKEEHPLWDDIKGGTKPVKMLKAETIAAITLLMG